MSALGLIAMGRLAPLVSQEKPPAPPPEVAIIVHAQNKVPDPSLKELRSLLTLERQFWSDGGRISLVQRPSKSVEGKVLLLKVYGMTEAELRKHWVQKVFSGELPAIPSIVRTSEAAGATVKRSETAITAVLASEVPPGVRVLLVEGKRPGEPGYPLVGKPET